MDCQATMWAVVSLRVPVSAASKKGSKKDNHHLFAPPILTLLREPQFLSELL